MPSAMHSPEPALRVRAPTPGARTRHTKVMTYKTTTPESQQQCGLDVLADERLLAQEREAGHVAVKCTLESCDALFLLGEYPSGVPQRICGLNGSNVTLSRISDEIGQEWLRQDVSAGLYD